MAQTFVKSGILKTVYEYSVGQKLLKCFDLKPRKCCQVSGERRFLNSQVFKFQLHHLKNLLQNLGACL